MSKKVSKTAKNGKRVLRAKKATSVSTSQKIRNFLAKGLPVPEIAKKLDISTNFVHVVKSNTEKRSAKNLGLGLREYQYEKALSESLTPSVPPMKAKSEKAAEENKSYTREQTILDNIWEKIDKDMVNHPPHYKVGGIETIEFIEAKDLNFYLANVVKYVSRAGQKSASTELEDLRKAQWYLDRYILRLENESEQNTH